MLPVLAEAVNLTEIIMEIGTGGIWFYAQNDKKRTLSECLVMSGIEDGAHFESLQHTVFIVL